MFRFIALLSLLSSVVSFLQNGGAARSMIKAAAPKLVGLAPAVVAAPAFASDLIQSTMPLNLEVTFAAYLAVLLGTFVPVTFLIVLYSQSEARKAGAREGQ